MTKETKTREHSYTTEPEDINPAPETSYAERARTIAATNWQGVLSTHSNKVEGFPFGSTMPFALDAKGRPIFLISGMAMHTQNLAKNTRASLFITVPEAQTDPLGAARLAERFRIERHLALVFFLPDIQPHIGLEVDDRPTSAGPLTKREIDNSLNQRTVFSFEHDGALPKERLLLPRRRLGLSK